MTTPLRLIGYVRVSTEEQGSHGHSVAQQARMLHAYCELHGYELVAVVEDVGVSASKPFERRVGGARVLELLEDGAAQGMLIRDLDRAFRLALDGLMTFALFDRSGWSVHVVNDRIETESPEGKMMLTVRLATAEYERNKTAQRTRATMAGLREQGKVYGHAPYGTVSVDGHLYRDPETWPVRERIGELRREAQVGLRAICTELNDEGVPAPNGGIWHPSTVKRVIDSHHDLEHIPALPARDEAGDSVGDEIATIHLYRGATA